MIAMANQQRRDELNLKCKLLQRLLDRAIVFFLSFPVVITPTATQKQNDQRKKSIERQANCAHTSEQKKKTENSPFSVDKLFETVRNLSGGKSKNVPQLNNSISFAQFIL